MRRSQVSGLEYSFVHYFAMTATWEKKLTYFAVDTGTTNTTVWLMKDDRILRESKHPVGVRQTSIRGDRELLESTLRGTLRSLSRRAPSPPRFVLAAGMLTSQLGLLEVPHVLAPAGVGKLAENVRMKSFARVSPLPFFLVPGVRIGRAPCELSEVAHSDVIRGEETEIVGFQANAQPRTHGAPWLLLHVGSHSKAIGWMPGVELCDRPVRSLGKHCTP